ncbi:type VII secretion target [Nocardia amamiensis]|uniref:type VII secretion target n=1 Tax=Nocardia amamiensis TaxID=404578 RepID=UPI0008315005|nr:type VII secretion target [Nocardia amamiensis]
MFNVDPARMRELAKDVRTNADALAGKAPIALASRQQVRPQMIDSNFATKIEEVLQAMDTVIGYHTRRLRECCDEIDRQATAYENVDQHRAADLNGNGR